MWPGKCLRMLTLIFFFRVVNFRPASGACVEGDLTCGDADMKGQKTHLVPASDAVPGAVFLAQHGWELTN
uniref:Uncharacterized protein n=1 Tax=Arundo donax TaxID=35708 RepID=A0A0A9AYV7_ARUDO